MSDLIVASIEFIVEGDLALDLDSLFPREKQFVQRELMEAGERGIYNVVQVDAENEKRFVRQLKDDKGVVLYFKFPANYKVELPRLIGNYNPDWGIVRKAPNGGLRLYLVRETKGSLNLESLQFPAERRKVGCAEKYFAAIKLDYRVVTGDSEGWWEPGPQQDPLI